MTDNIEGDAWTLSPRDTDGAWFLVYRNSADGAKMTKCHDDDLEELHELAGEAAGTNPASCEHCGSPIHALPSLLPGADEIDGQYDKPVVWGDIPYCSIACLGDDIHLTDE